MVKYQDGSQNVSVTCSGCGGAKGKNVETKYQVQDKDGTWREAKGSVWKECGTCHGNGTVMQRR